MRPLIPEASGAPGPRVLNRRGAGAGRRDPAPSRLSYRMHRLWLTPLFRTLLTVGAPAYVAILALGVFPRLVFGIQDAAVSNIVRYIGG